MQQVPDPVCGRMLSQDTAAAQMTNGRRDFLFCSERCQEAFQAEPGRYVDLERHEPPFTVGGRFAVPKFGSAGSGGLEHEPGPERHGSKPKRTSGSG